MQTNRSLPSGTGGEQHVIGGHDGVELCTAALQCDLGSPVGLKTAGQTLTQAALVQRRAELLPMMFDFIGKVAGKFEARNHTMDVEDVLERAREYHFLHSSAL